MCRRAEPIRRAEPTVKLNRPIDVYVGISCTKPLLAFRNRTGLAGNRTLILEKEDWYTAGVDGDTTLVNHIPLLFGEMHNKLLRFIRPRPRTGVGKFL